MNILVYEFIYRIVRLFNVPISRVFGSHEELQEIIMSVAGPPGHALDLGCGDGRDAIFLAENGFDVTADFLAHCDQDGTQERARSGRKSEFRPG